MVARIWWDADYGLAVDPGDDLQEAPRHELPLIRLQPFLMELAQARWQLVVHRVRLMRVSSE